ncbi:YkoF family thiamine/hydroxymethylpyrimidine-binding protein [Aurantimonas sp. C2-6-R+9]|uniref:YkoF family thiamine/hydroxymethylpyrimidine-binding protein n=1 Tax=unclassified Aurantimonas TaxID=2638230 RepID=UPI002E192772|nr:MULTISPECIES: YkoF family thiamine/hydroxymethylpyrimidine-binding protein [unclassified Aurantimonas]MEC5293536.1 YkoF family thiamine/hydroxymethylpyrimidine-binding protein [Aurantimonas sp. C2-3-R2]MEC5383720.1 YkoF family thiamine/hydroxymethylpyrimidine-binding protein [Aurantimonas sp. C2-6-R+9]MEC5414610.1 YkoF family thiamine/hydroxymethylpyrimidine-binding protein [Aurantimonas sp. C2-4-R8]
MFSGAQISLYPMTDGFVSVILGSLSALDPYRERFRIETDDISTLIVGPPEELFAAMRDLFVAAAKTGTHTVLSATVSRGCPGEPDDGLCTPTADLQPHGDLEERVRGAVSAVAAAAPTTQAVSAQFSYYPLGAAYHMDEIYACIDFLKTSGVFDRSKNFCTKLSGDAGPVFAALSEAFLRFAPAEAHVALDVTVSANSPSNA